MWILVFKNTWGLRFSLSTVECLRMVSTKMLSGRIKWELTEREGKVCIVQVFGQKPLYPGKQWSPRATYHCKGIPWPRRVQDGIDDMHASVRSLFKRYKLQTCPYSSLTQIVAPSNTVAFHNIPGSCCIVCQEVCTMACWEGTTVREETIW